MKFFLVFLICIFTTQATAQTVGESTGLKIPRFVSIRGDQAFARAGPGTRYPIKWVYQSQNLPVEIIQEFDTWRKIRDVDGEEGWVHQSLLSGKRFAIINSEDNRIMHKTASEDSRPIALLEPSLIVSVIQCKNDWCRIAKKGFSGWIPLKSLWGVYEGEQIE
jgi:SH3-like domain-containing protein